MSSELLGIKEARLKTFFEAVDDGKTFFSFIQILFFYPCILSSRLIIIVNLLKYMSALLAFFKIVQQIKKHKVI